MPRAKRTDSTRTVAQTLTALREQASLTVADLAAKASLSRTHLHNLEAGLRKPTFETVKKIAAALGVSLAVFDDAGGEK